jgi:hypothetical protein
MPNPNKVGLAKIRREGANTAMKAAATINAAITRTGAPKCGMKQYSEWARNRT